VRDLTPRQIVAELDRHIVGQKEAKRAVAIALRNRWRRQRLPQELQNEIAPKNIMMIGPTGVGKTEIARRLAKLTGAPFIKVEATKFTEVGYYGRDVESMVRELVENAITLVREQERQRVEAEAAERVEQRLVELLAPAPPMGFDESQNQEAAARHERTREKMRTMLAAGELENRMVEVTIQQKAAPVMFTGTGLEQMDFDLQGMFEKILPKNSKRREVTVAEARKILFEQECEALINQEKVHTQAIELAANLGIIFLDEIDKIASAETRGADVSRQGVQRDLLPIVEGTTVQTKYGYIATDHILFIAAGAFHRAKPSDLMPELQGRFPIRVELSDLTREDFIRILKEPKNALTRQYEALLGTEGVQVEFTDDAIEALADYAFRVNQTTQNIGARRLATIMERLLEELSFEAADMKMGKVTINAAYVTERLQEVADDEDLSKFIL
jgi:ATP-dependent HslUV protease ATP-binding subunit HslU